MNATIIALIGYIIWLMALLFLLAGYRSIVGKKDNSKNLKFSSDGTDLNPLGQRITRVHLNAVECFPFIGGLLLVAIVTDSMAITNGLALTVLLARVLQTVIHLVSTSNLMVMVRFSAFLIQFGICGYWALQLLIKFW